MEAKKRGRPPLYKLAMTGAERARRHRAGLDAESVGSLLRGQVDDPDNAGKILRILLRLQGDFGTGRATELVARVLEAVPAAERPEAERRLAAALKMLKAWKRLYAGKVKP